MADHSILSVTVGRIYVKTPDTMIDDVLIDTGNLFQARDIATGNAVSSPVIGRVLVVGEESFAVAFAGCESK